MILNISPSPKRVGLVLAAAGFVTALLSAICDFVGQRYDVDRLWAVMRQFNVTEEGNFVNWYQSMTLLVCAALLAAIGSVKRKSGGRYPRHWFFLALVFLFVSMDESAQVHEMSVTTLIAQFRGKRETGTDPGKNQTLDVTEKEGKDGNDGKEVKEDNAGSRLTWMWIYLPVFLIMVAIYWRFFLDLPPGNRMFFVIAATLYLGGAVGVETMGDRLGIPFADQVSELMEMLGVAAFVYTLMGYLDDQTSAPKAQA